MLNINMIIFKNTDYWQLLKDLPAVDIGAQY